MIFYWDFWLLFVIFALVMIHLRVCQLRDVHNVEQWLRAFIPHDDIGWIEHGERFTRYNVIKCRWFNLYIHQMWSPIAPPACHDHPWSFVTFILRGGYWESQDGTTWKFQRPGYILYRPAAFAHTVKTVDRYAWSVVVTSRTVRQWANRDCKTREIVAHS